MDTGDKMKTIFIVRVYNVSPNEFLNMAFEEAEDAESYGRIIGNKYYEKIPEVRIEAMRLKAKEDK